MGYITNEAQSIKNEIIDLLSVKNLDNSKIKLIEKAIDNSISSQKTSSIFSILNTLIKDEELERTVKKLTKTAIELQKINVGSVSNYSSFLSKNNTKKDDINPFKDLGFEDEKKLKEGYVALGINGNSNYIYSNYKQCIVELTAQNLNKAFLQNAIGFNFVDSICMSFNKFGKKEYNIDVLSQKIVEECVKKGLFNASNLNGSGIFRHPQNNDALIINSSSVWSKNNENEERIFGKKVFENNIDLEIKKDDVVVTQLQATDFLKFINSFNFTKKDDAALCAGWIASSALAGDSNHRPILNITAPAGSGKSSFIHATKQFLGNFAIDYDGQATEAGIRQIVKNNSLVLLLDEAEATSEKLASILTLLRGAYSGTNIIKGTSDQKGMQFVIKMQSMLVGIVPPALNAADASRIIRVEMTVQKEKNKEFFNKINKEIDEIGKSIIMFLINNYVKYKHICKRVREQILDRIDSNRFADTYTTSIATSFLLNHINFLSENDDAAVLKNEEFNSKIDEYVSKIELEYYSDMSKQSNDEDQFFEELLKTQLSDKELGNKSVIELINVIKYKKCVGENIDAYKIADSILQRTGLKFKDDSLIVDTKSESLKRAIKNIKYKNADYIYLLKRVNNSQILTDRVIIGGTRVARSTAIKMKIDFDLNEKINKENDDDNVF